MKVLYRSSFLKDIKKLKSGITVNLIQSAIDNCEKAVTIAEIKNCEPLQKHGICIKKSLCEAI